MPAEAIGSTRYEEIMQAADAWPVDLGERFAGASRVARAAVTAAPGHEAAIRNVAAGAAGPALVAFALWLLEESERRGLRRLRFLSRDGQVLYEMACRLAAATGSGPDLEYVYSSRLTWSLAATDPRSLAQTAWLYNGFIHSNAADVCSRRGLPAAGFRQVMLDCGVSLDPDARAGQPAQAEALRRFAASPEVVEAAGARISMMRRLVLDYAAQHRLADAATGLVDIGWTGRMAGAFIELCEAAGMSRPAVLFWGHEPRATGWTDPDRVAAWMYNTATGHGLQLRVPNAPFIMETFCMGDHGIVSGYRKDADGTIRPQVISPRNDRADAWGLRRYRSVLYAFTEALATDGLLPPGDPRPLVHQVLDAFWCNPTRAEALAWGSYPYDTDPAGTAACPLARPFTAADHVRGDRAWLAGSLVLSDPAAQAAYLHSASESELAGAPRDRLIVPASGYVRVWYGIGHFLHQQLPGQFNALALSWLDRRLALRPLLAWDRPRVGERCQDGRSGLPPGTRISNPRIKRPLLSSRYSTTICAFAPVPAKMCPCHAEHCTG
jgi:hypothetical protein